ncbi:MAG: class I SAM-dependent methyltransferase [Candidatus Solibacter usitatus]|nr:class I SAM-dependent methyltransferase [Candidatus Solibacter usitatus]
MEAQDFVAGIEPASDLILTTGRDVCPSCSCGEMRSIFSGSDTLYRTSEDSFLIVQCANCGLMRLYPWPEPAKLFHYYPRDYWYVPEEDASGRFAEIYRRFVLSDHVRFVQRAVRESEEEGVVADVGCGGGLFLSMMARRGARVLGIDFALHAAHAAWKVNGVPAICGSLGHSPLAPESCAAVTMFHVLEHLYDPVAYVEEARRMLKPNGRLIVQVPNADCWQFLLLGERWNGVDIPRHLFHFRARDLRGLLQDCGFEIVREKHFSWRDNPAGLATSIAPWLDPMSRRVRQVPESPNVTILKDLTYFGLVLLSWPVTLLEAACRRGSTIMMEARKKA